MTLYDVIKYDNDPNHCTACEITQSYILKAG